MQGVQCIRFGVSSILHASGFRVGVYARAFGIFVLWLVKCTAIISLVLKREWGSGSL